MVGVPAVIDVQDGYRLGNVIDGVAYAVLAAPDSPAALEWLLEPLAPQYSARRGEYRVLYLIEDGQVTVIVTSVTHRADAYRTR